MGKQEINALSLLAEDSFGRKSTVIYHTKITYPLDMLIEDLLKSGVEIKQVVYEEIAEVGLQFLKGSLSADDFVKQYHELKCSGTNGMEYRVDCLWQGIAFELNTENDKQGHPDDRLQLICPVEQPIDLLTILRA